MPGSANKKRFLGAQFNFQTEWQATSHISVNAAYVHFLTEGFLRAAGAKGIDFVGRLGIIQILRVLDHASRYASQDERSHLGELS